MERFTECESTREEIKNKLRQNFDGKIAKHLPSNDIGVKWMSK